jgi:hypothetical protein
VQFVGDKLLYNSTRCSHIASDNIIIKQGTVTSSFAKSALAIGRHVKRTNV